MRQFYVYVLANESRLMYIGVTRDLSIRLAQHRESDSSFVAKYRIYKRVYFETTTDVRVAIAREKQLKGWVRKKKKELVESINPEWKDLSMDWGSL